jgi:integrase/recombinase XerD
MEQTQLIFRRGIHSIGPVIQIIFDYDAVVIEQIKSQGARWSAKMKCWYVADSDENGKIFNVEEEVRAEGDFQKILEANKEALKLFVQLLQLKGYSPRTLALYKHEFTQLLIVIKQKPVNTLTHQNLKDYFNWCIVKQKLGESTIHSRLNAVKFYFEQVLHGEKFYWDIPRPKKAFKLSKVISEEKILKGIFTLENLKHRALLLTAYSAGLRVSEVVAIKLTDVDSDRMQIRIEAAKGKKDRMVTLGKATLQILREYFRVYKPAKYLFEGQNGNGPYSTKSAQSVFNKVFKQMGLAPTISFHSLRHSYATHLLENGTDIKFIQELLGHNDIRTTLRYTHVSKKQLGKIESPIDIILRNKIK